MHRYWHELTTKDFAALDRESAVALLPVGAIEQHGPHLPVYVDTCLTEGVVAHMLEKLPETQQLLVLPTQAVGKSNEHLAYPGTLTLSAETLTRLWTEIGESVHRAGINRLIILNAHGGQPQVMEIVARELRVRLGMFVVTLNWWGPGQPEGLFPESELRHGIHGGAVETSMMLYLRPDLVRMEKARNFKSLSETLADEYKYLAPEGAVGFGWQTQDLNEEGACGDATLADPEKGRLLVDHAATALAELVGEVAGYPMDRIKPGPSR